MDKQIPTFEKAFDILELPEYLNGLECQWVRLMESDKEKPILIETCRRLQDLYDEICAGRFALVTACKSKYPEFVSSNDNGKGHLWIQSQFVNTAILWYNASFDILLQTVWIYFKLYEHIKPSLKLNSENIDSILSKCKIKKFDKSILGEQMYNLLSDFSDDYKSTISEWANILKHRRMLEYRELSNKKHPACFQTIPCHQGEYNSQKTLNIYNMNDVINKLFDFHKDLCRLAKSIFDNIDI